MNYRVGMRGDTIIEVLVAITIVSSVLAGAYASVNRTTIAGRQSQERSEALRLVEGQLERLKSLSTTADSPIYTGVSPFCITTSNTVQAPVIPAACDNSVLGVTYQLSITRDSSTGRIFTVSATWERAGGGAPEVMNLTYRLYPL